MSNTQSKQKPYGYLKLSNSKFYREVEGVVDIDNDPEYLTLYTHPYTGQPQREPLEHAWLTYKREWVGLTEKEILECRSVNHLYFYKAIEAKLKEKNT